MNEHPVVMEKISATIEKVELVAGGFCSFKMAKCSKVVFVLMSIILVAGVVITVAGPHMDHMHGQRGPHRPHGPHGRRGPHPPNGPPQRPPHGPNGPHGPHGPNMPPKQPEMPVDESSMSVDGNNRRLLGGRHHRGNRMRQSAPKPEINSSSESRPENNEADHKNRDGRHHRGGRRRGGRRGGKRRGGCKRRKEMMRKMLGFKNKDEYHMFKARAFATFFTTSDDEWKKRFDFPAEQSEEKWDIIRNSFERLPGHKKKLIVMGSAFIEKEHENTNPEWATSLPTLASTDAAITAELEKQKAADIAAFKETLYHQKYQQLALFTFGLAKSGRHGGDDDGPLCPIILVWLVSLVFMCCSGRKSRKLKDRIETLLTLENRTIFRDLGFVWSINTSLTKLTLSKMGQAPPVNQNYPQSNPFVTPTPMTVPVRQNNVVHPQNYVTVPMDDSMMSIRDTEYR